MKLTAEKQQYLAAVFGAERAAAIIKALASQEKSSDPRNNPALRNFSTPTGQKASAGQLMAFLRNVFDEDEVSAIIAAIDAGYGEQLGNMYFEQPDKAPHAARFLFSKELADYRRALAELKAANKALNDPPPLPKPAFNPFPGVKKGQKRRKDGPFDPFPGATASNKKARTHISRASLHAAFGAKAAEIIRRLERSGHTTTDSFNPFPGVVNDD